MVGHSDSRIKKRVVTAGIDSALRKVGLCVYRDGQFELTLIKPAPKLRGTERLVDLRTKVMAVLLEAKPDLVAIEGYSYDSVGRWFDLGEIGGVLKVELMVQAIPTAVVPPCSLKQFMTGNGQASKERVIAAVQEHLNVITDNDDLADAASAAHFAYVMATGQSVRRCELEAVRKLGKANDKLPKKVFKKFWVAV